jgi:molybdopterin-guanine dinucleotide biosynthesis protein A
VRQETTIQAGMVNRRSNVAGVILAGGQSRRFGSPKAFAVLAGASLINHVIARTAPQVSRLLLSVPDESCFAALSLTCVTDDVKERGGEGAGPLAGVLAALDWLATHEPEIRWLASFAVDTPLLPENMVERLWAAAERDGAELACSRSAGRLHPLQALWSVDLRPALRMALTSGERAAHRFAAQHRLVIVDFSAEPFDPFANVNTLADLERLAQVFNRRDRAPRPAK